MDIDKAIGIAIAQIRVERDMSQAKAAQSAGISRGQWGKLETGIHWPSRRSMAAICDGLDVAPSEVFYAVADFLSSQECRNGLKNEL